jgi:Protein of unknown function (DUF2917)
MNPTRFARFPMKKGEVIKVSQPKGCTIKADSGQLWITQTDISDDFFVAAGEVYTASQDGVLIAEAMSNSFMSLTYPEAHTNTSVSTKPAVASPAGFANGLVVMGAVS